METQNPDRFSGREDSSLGQRRTYRLSVGLWLPLSDVISIDLGLCFMEFQSETSDLGFSFALSNVHGTDQRPPDFRISPTSYSWAHRC